MAADVIIRKQKIKVTTVNETVALHLRKHLNGSLQYNLIAMLEEVFSKYDVANVYINIDKLKVNIGEVSLDDFEKNFFQIASPYLAGAVQKHLQQNEQLFKEFEKHQQANSGTDATHPLTLNGGKQQQINALFHFLKSGVYPWWHKDQNHTPSQILQTLNEGENETLLLKIFETRKNNHAGELNNIIERLFIHLPSARHEATINRLLNLLNDSSLSNNIRVLLKNADQLTRLFSFTQTEFNKKLFTFLIAGTTADHRNAIFDFINILKKDTNISDIALASKSAPINVTDELKQILETLVTEERCNNKEVTSPEPQEDPLSLNNKNKTQIKKPSSSSDEEQGFYINNSGLVLLHPFLQSLFQELGVLNEQHQFVSLAAKYKAAVLLYYLQCGEQEYKEWQMLLNKILCNIPVDDVIPGGILITPGEVAECNTLLQTIVNYWEALKGSSPQAVQQTFILREGKISFKEDHWMLQVERTGTDILLDRLPWGFSTIRFPWLPNIIYTEW